jgi:hypothetical protein
VLQTDFHNEFGAKEDGNVGIFLAEFWRDGTSGLKSNFFSSPVKKVPPEIGQYL